MCWWWWYTWVIANQNNTFRSTHFFLFDFVLCDGWLTHAEIMFDDCFFLFIFVTNAHRMKLFCIFFFSIQLIASDRKSKRAREIGEEALSFYWIPTFKELFMRTNYFLTLEIVPANCYLFFVIFFLFLCDFLVVFFSHWQLSPCNLTTTKRPSFQLHSSNLFHSFNRRK